MALVVEKNKIGLSCPIDLYGRGIPALSITTEGDSLPKESSLFSPSLARVAAALSISAGDERMVKENLSALHYGDHVVIDRPDRLWMIMGSRIRDNMLETAVAIRGSEGGEWLSNFDIGYSAEHSGFGKAADIAEQELTDYLFTRLIGTQPRFFITGYSRGGAVANILSKRLCDRFGTDSVRGYTLASPAVTVSRRQARYNSIFNLIRAEDFFTRVPLENWGYTRYGKDVPLTGDISDGYRALTREDYAGFSKRGEVDSLIAAVMRLAPNVPAYYKRRREVGGKPLSLYEFMREVSGITSGHPEDAGDVFLSAMVSDYSDLTELLSAGMELTELMTCTGTPRCSIADSHSPAAYLSAIKLTL